MRHIMSNVAELVGACLVVAGIWMASGTAPALIVAGVVVFVYAWRLDR